MIQEPKFARTLFGNPLLRCGLICSLATVSFLCGATSLRAQNGATTALAAADDRDDDEDDPDDDEVQRKPDITLTLEQAAAVRSIVPGFERFGLLRGSDTARNGRLLLGELGCTACHLPEAAAPDFTLPKQSPILDGVGERVRVEYLRKFLSSPHGTKAGTTMPDLLANLPEADRTTRVEALVHFLASTGKARDTFPNPAAAKRGETLYHEVGCVACHGPRDGSAPVTATSVPLPDVAAKYTVASLTEFLMNPHTVRPSGRMPALNLQGQQARDIASYFLKGIDVPGNVQYAYYEGDWNRIPDFDKLTPKSTGVTGDIDLGMAEREDDFGLRFDGYLHVAKPGEFTFTLGSDDGSRLLIDGNIVINHDGEHGFVVKDGKTELAAGPHAVRVEYFEAHVDANLAVTIAGPDVSEQPLGGMLSVEPEPRSASPGFEVNPDLAAQGRTFFAQLGCASCHTLHSGDKRIITKLVAPLLRNIRADHGCLAETVSGALPKYRLDTAQRAALNAAIQQIDDSPAPLAPAESVDRTLVTFNCYACHARGEVGGVEGTRDHDFATAIPEMGEEGRLPPTLTGVGDKLNKDWITYILTNGSSERPYMRTRMPRFGADNVGHLAALFASLDQQPETPAPTIAEAGYRVKGLGRHMVGEKALSCVKCHPFAGQRASGIQAVDLATMTKRLRRDWFHRYMVDPQTYRPGTRMPSAWPNGKSILPNVLAGDTEQQLEAIWIYLADGEGAAIPAGIGSQPIELVPKDEPIIYRNFLSGLNPRGIAVGYPEGVNIAYDADALSLATIWHGAFIDASRHWTGRGQGAQGPLGDHVFSLSTGIPLAVLESTSAPWPTGTARDAGFHFRGYRLEKERRPAFLYSLDELQVVDFPRPVAAKPDPQIERTLTLTSASPPIANLWYRAAAGTSIENRDDGSYLLNGAVQLKFTLEPDTPAPLVRTVEGQTELLIPVVFHNNVARIVQTYTW